MTESAVTDAELAGAPPERRGNGRWPGSANRKALLTRASSAFLTDGLVVALLVAWYFGAKHVQPYLLPSPQSVGSKVLDLLGRDPTLAENTLVSAERVVASVVLALALGSALVIVARYVPVLRGFIVNRFMPFMNAMPALGWAIVGLFWFHVSNSGVVFVEVVILLPFVMINMWEGMKELDNDLLEMTLSFTRNRPRTLIKIILPLLLPYIFASLRISFGTAWKIALFAELFGAPSGLGYLINLAQQNTDSVTVFAAIIIIIGIVFIVQRLVFDQIEKLMFKQRAAVSSQGSVKAPL
jgi:ABC-type nitrate/sulfonate/bicarbonate transport system permease component